MPPPATNPKQEAHELFDRLSTGQVNAAIGLFKAMLDPVSVALANAPIDDEPVSEVEARDIAAARSSLARGEGIPHDEVLREFGLSPIDFEQMGHTPLDPESHNPGH